MLEAALWGAAGGSSLVVGAAIGLRFQFGSRTIGLIMGFGSGVLISALTFELTEEAFRVGGADALVIGLVLGALSFFGRTGTSIAGGASTERDPEVSKSQAARTRS